jgi:hypothetical protein
MFLEPAPPAAMRDLHAGRACCLRDRAKIMLAADGKTLEPRGPARLRCLASAAGRRLCWERAAPAMGGERGAVPTAWCAQARAVLARRMPCLPAAPVREEAPGRGWAWCAQAWAQVAGSKLRPGRRLRARSLRPGRRFKAQVQRSGSEVRPGRRFKGLVFQSCGRFKARSLRPG